MPDSGYWILDARYEIRDTLHEIRATNDIEGSKTSDNEKFTGRPNEESCSHQIDQAFENRNSSSYLCPFFPDFRLSIGFGDYPDDRFRLSTPERRCLLRA